MELPADLSKPIPQRFMLAIGPNTATILMHYGHRKAIRDSQGVYTDAVIAAYKATVAEIKARGKSGLYAPRDPVIEAEIQAHLDKTVREYEFCKQCSALADAAGV